MLEIKINSSINKHKERTALKILKTFEKQTKKSILT